MKLVRGSTLLVVLVVLVIVALLGAAIVTASMGTVSEARNRESAVGLSNCTQAIRHYIYSVVQGNAALTSLSFTLPGTTTPITLQGGHYDAINVTSFILPSGPTFGGITGPDVEQLGNAMPLVALGGASTTIGSAVCTDGNGRSYEVEFSFSK